MFLHLLEAHWFSRHFLEVPRSAQIGHVLSPGWAGPVVSRCWWIWTQLCWTTSHTGTNCSHMMAPPTCTEENCSLRSH